MPGYVLWMLSGNLSRNPASGQRESSGDLDNSARPGSLGVNHPATIAIRRLSAAKQ